MRRQMQATHGRGCTAVGYREIEERWRPWRSDSIGRAWASDSPGLHRQEAGAGRQLFRCSLTTEPHTCPMPLGGQGWDARFISGEMGRRPDARLSPMLAGAESERPPGRQGSHQASLPQVCVYGASGAPALRQDHVGSHWAQPLAGVCVHGASGAPALRRDHVGSHRAQPLAGV